MSDHFVQLLTSGASGLAGLFAYLKARQVGNQVHEVHLSMNSRLEEMLQLARQAAHAEGMNEGIATEQARVSQVSTDAPVTVVGSPVIVNNTPPGGTPAPHEGES